MPNLITLTTLIGGVMLVLSIVFLIVGINSARKNRKVVGSETRSGPFILMGFALLAMGLLTFLFGTFRPGP